MRIENHPILGPLPEAETLTLLVDGKPLLARRGETVAAALAAHGIRSFRHTAKGHQPRGIFCGIGQCTDCAMEVNGVPNVRVCVTLAEDGMEIRSQEGCGGQ